MVIRSDKMTIKKTARNALNVCSAIYLSGEYDSNGETELIRFLTSTIASSVPMFWAQTQAILVEKIQQQHEEFRESKVSKAASQIGVNDKASGMRQP